MQCIAMQQRQVKMDLDHTSHFGAFSAIFFNYHNFFKDGKSQFNLRSSKYANCCWGALGVNQRKGALEICLHCLHNIDCTIFLPQYFLHNISSTIFLARYYLHIFVCTTVIIIDRCTGSSQPMKR